MFGELGGFEFRDITRIAGGTLVSFGEDFFGDVVEGPFVGGDNVAQGVAGDGVRAGYHSKENRIGAEVSDT